jgi:phage terminase large subunit GpA-like protein
MLCQNPPQPEPGALVLRVPADMAPPGLPERCEVRLYPGERKVWRSRRGQRCSQWAEANRVVTMTSRPGQWRNDTTPYLAGIMDASWSPSVRVVICCKTPQVGMSEAVNNCVGYAIDCDPAPVLYVYPDEITARHNSDARIQQMINDTPRLAGYKTGYQDDMATLEIKLQHMALYLAWASSAAGLANKPIKYLVLDEVDKYPPAGKREADPISLAEQRLTTYEDDSKEWKISTPTVEAGAIWQALKTEAQEIYHYWVRCPLCGCWQLMRFGERDAEDRKPGGIRFPADERNPETIEAQRLAWYECEHCQGQWTDALRNKAVRLGEWRDEEGCELMASLRTKRPTKIGFHIPAWISPFVSLSKCAGEFLRGLKDKVKMRAFQNGIKAEPWRDYKVERSHDRILALRDERPEGTVPGGGVVAGIVAGVDTQDNGFPYEIRAFGYGLAQASWQVRAGFVTTLEALHDVLFEEPIYDAEGNQYFVELALIDSQGHRTSEIYDWARLHRGRVYAFKGEQRMRQPFDFSRIEYYPTRKGDKKAIPGGLVLLRADVNLHKDRLSTLLEVNPADPGAWRMNAACTEAWARQMTVEYIGDDGMWHCPEHAANHAWDCSNYALIAAEVRRLKFRPRPEEQTQQHKKTTPQKPQRGSTRW